VAAAAPEPEFTREPLPGILGRIAWPEHRCVACDGVAEAEFGAPVFRWPLLDSASTGQTVCRACFELARSLPGAVTIPRVRRWRCIR
jgi:hypothetical protein